MLPINKKNNVIGKNKMSKRKKKVLLIVGLIVLLVVVGFCYTLARGSKIFQANIGGGSPFFGGKTDLKGEGDDRINILAMGMGGANHPGGQLTDSMMVISINPKDKSLAMLSIPRDLYVPIADHKVSSKINEVYNLGEREKKGNGPALVKKTVGNILDLPIHYYVTVDFKAFEKAINILGGLDLYVDRAISDPLYPADDMVHYSPFYIKAGQQHLDGATALKYSRSRETSSDFDRAARQQKVLKAAKEKALKLGFLANPKKVIDLSATVSDNVRTDLSPGEVKTLLGIVKDIPGDKIISKVLADGNGGALVSDSSTGTYYLKPKDGTFDEIKQIAHEIFTDPNLAEESAKIEVLNGSNQSGLAAKLAVSLRSYGYQVINVDSTDEQYKKTLIYDHSKGAKKTTLQFLKTRLQSDVIEKAAAADAQPSPDITIIIGDDYKGFTNKTN